MLRWTLLLSAGLHVLVGGILLFEFRSNRMNNETSARVSVDFIQAVSHDSASSHHPEQKQAEIESPAKAPSQDGRALVQEQTGSDANYIAQVTGEINRAKSYPRMSIARQEQGRVMIAVTVSREGEILSTEVEEPSHFPRLNEAALEAIRKVGRFPKIPDSMTAPQHLHIPLKFVIQN